ncbi:alpha/beta-Hydrolases superfamily protein [Raphanus sativus]|nr:alpha/beta-Hydrolases superfamily protein [Raphanus sativus]
MISARQCRVLEITKALYEKASSRDKTLKLYPGMWHALTSAEPDYNVDLVFADIITWLDHQTADPTSLTVTPIRANAIASVERVIVDGVSIGQRRPRHAYFNLLCGLNGGRLVPRSAQSRPWTKPNETFVLDPQKF